jgi:predicted SAM-dependent methyltransferase
MTTSENRHFDILELNRDLHDCNVLHGAVGSLNPRPPGIHNQLIQFAKKLMRRALSWYTRPLHQFQAAVTRTLNDIAMAIEGFAMAIEGFQRLELAWHQNIPAFLNAISTVNAFAHELAKLRRESEQGFREIRGESAQLAQHLSQGLELANSRVQATSQSVSATWERIEFTRREMLYEMKYGRRNFFPAGDQLEILQPKIISSSKIDRARELGIKLNLGCGHLPLKDYVNIDRRELPGVDIVTDVGDLPFDDGSVAEIFSAHLLEHFPQEMLRRRLLPVWWGLLMPGGTFRAVVPDGEAMLAGVAASTYTFSDFREVLFGAQDYNGDFHFNLFTPDSMCGILEEVGFSDIRINIRARPNGKCFEFEVSAEKPRQQTNGIR